ncbi:MAG: twin-arginine translocation pathway signal protein [Alphaproteobacteria bacterium]|nr:twin-arginine translocation pathway signal protein [Alphaproteobacteria bacterium]MBE8220261.1 twin-arginine translocation pathway signal protein [Alphaproteobacteria bacterium]
MQRRHILKLIGGGVVISAAAMGGFLGTRTPHHALAPWMQTDVYDDVRLNALSYAILAPNPHNRQPWMAELVGTDAIRIYRDTDKNLPHTDPFDRQLTIGMGCFLECLDLALGNYGYNSSTRLFPTERDSYVAEVTLYKEAAQKKNDKRLFQSILARRSNKQPFMAKPLSDAHTLAMRAYGDVYTDAKSVQTLKDISYEAWLIEYQTPHTLQESIDLMRIGKSSINAQPDGIDLGGPLMETLNLAGVITHEELMDPQSSAYAQGIDIYKAMLLSTPAYILVKSDDNGRADQIKAGRRWLRLNLAATDLGLSVQPISQALQEYPEMRPHYQKIHKAFAYTGETIQMFGRLGYGPAAAPAPRWALEHKLI